jgi:hypothetical protein
MVVDPRKAKPKQDVRNMWPARPLEMGSLVLVLGRMCRGAYLVATVLSYCGIALALALARRSGGSLVHSCSSRNGRIVFRVADA